MIFLNSEVDKLLDNNKQLNHLNRNYQIKPKLKWLYLWLINIPEKYEFLVRYYGYNVNRSRRRKRT